MVFELWTAAIIETRRIFGSTIASITSRIHGEFSLLKGPGSGEYGMLFMWSSHQRQGSRRSAGVHASLRIDESGLRINGTSAYFVSSQPQNCDSLKTISELNPIARNSASLSVRVLGYIQPRRAFALLMICSDEKPFLAFISQ